MSAISLLREKFTIREIALDSTPVIALGNRFIVNLPKQKIPIIIRGHSMHMTLRLGAELMRQLSYMTHVENIESLLNWEEIWEKIVNPYERKATPETWIAIYYKGKVIFEDNYHHMFFDVIEQCEYKNNMESDRYQKSIEMAQNAFRQMERNVLIEEESHVGFILDDDSPDELRQAIILRMPGHRSTFVTRLNKGQMQPTVFTAINIAADYIEAVNMAVRLGFMERSMTDPNFKNKSSQAVIIKDLQSRLATLKFRISQAEIKYKLHYRPEKPDFEEISRKCFEA